MNGRTVGRQPKAFVESGSRPFPFRTVVALIGLCLFEATVFKPAAFAYDQGRSYLEVSGGYKTGDFGTTTRADLYSLTPVLGIVTTDWEASVTLPYLSLSSETNGARATESGIGDLILRAGAVLFPDNGNGWSLDGALAVKIPTANENKGLGTGETDSGAFLTLNKRREWFKLSLMGGYLKVGDPPQADFDNVFLYGAGVSKAFGFSDVSLSLEGREATLAGADDPLEVNVGFFHVLNADWALKAQAFTGLNDGGPDFGASLGLVRWF